MMVLLTIGALLLGLVYGLTGLDLPAAESLPHYLTLPIFRS